jgi:hypothetical protein
MDLSNKSLSLQRAAKHVHKPGYKFPVEKRIEVVTKWLALGNMRLVAELTGVSYQLCREWKTSEWWQELVDEVKASRSLQLDNKLSKIVDKSLETIADRLENGDVVFNQKTGQVVRKEVSLKDATKVATDLLTRQAALQKQENEQMIQKDQGTIQDQLKLLAAEFAKFNGRNTGPVQDIPFVETTDAIHDEREDRITDAHDHLAQGAVNAVYDKWEEGLQEGSGEVYVEAGSQEEES